MARVPCPWCGHGKMHYGEWAELRDEVWDDVFSCRGCGSVYDVEEMEEAAGQEPFDLAEIRRVLAGKEESS